MSIFVRISSIAHTTYFKKFCASILLILLAVVPGSRASFFNGLPLSAGETIFCLTLVILIWGTNWLSKWRFFVWTILFLTFIHILSVSYLPVGWNICLKRGVALESLKTPCEPTAQFRDGTNSYMLKDISFTGKKFPLYFMNDLDLNYYQENQPRRNNLPYSLETFGYVYTWGKATDLVVTSTFADTILEINNKRVAVGVDNANIYKLTDAKNKVVIKYSAPRSDKDVFSVSVNRPVFTRDIGSGRFVANIFYKLLNYVGLIFLLLIFTPSILASFISLPKKNKYFIIIIAFLLPWLSFFAQKIVIVALPLAQYVLVFLPPAYGTYLDRIKEILPATLSFTIFPIYFICTQWLLVSLKMKNTIWQFLFIVAFSFFFVSTFVSPNTLTILSGGDDPLTHESFSRAVLLSQNIKEFLVGGENSIYYYQPLYRYVLAAVHYLFGEALFGMFIVQVMLVCALLRSTYIFLDYLGKKVVLVFSLLFLPIFIFSFTSLFGLATSVLQQAVAIPLFLLVVIYLFIFWLQKENKIISYCLLGLMLGLSIMTRTDLLPGMLGILLLLWYTVTALSNRRRGIVLGSSFIVCFLLPILFVGFRNFYIFGNFTILPQSSGVNLLGSFNEFFRIASSSSVGAGALYVKIILLYQHNLIDLVTILGKNIIENFIGYDPFRILIWYCAPIALFVAFIKKGANFKHLLVVTLIVIPMIVANSFYGVHNGWSMLMHFDFLLILLIALAAQTFEKRKKQVISEHLLVVAFWIKNA